MRSLAKAQSYVNLGEDQAQFEFQKPVFQTSVLIVVPYLSGASKIAV